jgi:arginyl-tRNA synthetase
MMTLRFIEPFVRTALEGMGVDPSHPVIFEIPRQQGHGHLSTTVALTLAKPLGRKPRDIAEEIVQRLGTVPMVEGFEIAGPGFINVTFHHGVFHDILGDLVRMDEGIGRSDVGTGKSVNVEYVSANPTGPLHAGHGRNCAIGDTVANLHAWCGYDVTREYYFNNAGNQMNKLGESIHARVMQALGQEVSFPEDGYHGDYIMDIATDIVTNKVEEYTSTADGDKHLYCRKQGEQWCFASIKKTLDRLNIHHDTFFNEDSLYADGSIQEVIDQLRSKDLVYDKDGATWFAVTKLDPDNENVQDRVIVKSSGEPTYRLPDIAYHKNKLERGFDIVVDIFGADHIATIPDVLAGVRALGLDESRVRTVIHQMVTFIEDNEVVKFSKRSGKAFTLDELIDEVGADVVRFFFIMRGVGTHLDFDLGLAKEEGDKNPVFYLQYAHARIASILRKAADLELAVDKEADLSSLTHESELALIALLSRFRTVVERACSSLEPLIVADYLRDLAAAYHQFYHDCRILGSDEPLQSARLLLADVTRKGMRNGLHILGVAAPDTM